MDLRGAVAVVTGASSGFGERTALRFAGAGSRVVLAARRLERLEALAGRIRAAGGQALAVRTAVAEPSELDALRDRTLEAFGRVDVLVNNAGVPGGGLFADADAESIERIVRVNLLGVLHGTRAFLPGMLERRHGHIVNVASLAGRFATPGAAVYGATKHAVVAFSEALFHELDGTGVLVTVVNPAFSPTEGFPSRGVRRPVRIEADAVARLIADVVRRGRGPEVSIPRSLAALQAFRVLTPPLYRWGVGATWRRFARAPNR
jgi:NADP-dependent 3-hydroxy acid dehydrogenase YdfG